MNLLFSTERLLFRQFTLEDAPLIYDLNSNPAVTKYLHEPETTMEVAVEVVATIILPQYEKYNHGRWAVYLKSTHEFIGWCGLKKLPEIMYPDLGYRFFQKHWGKGYATEAAKKAIEYGFAVLHLPGISASAHVENIASQKVMEKCGMRFTGEEEVDGIIARNYRVLNIL